MRKNTKIIAIVFGTLLIASVAISAVSTKLTTVSIGVWGETKPIYTLRGFYDRTITDYSGDTYHLHLNPDNGTFTGWYVSETGYVYNAYGTFVIEGNQISGTWQLDIGYSGWISGHIGVG
jgi:hypothetical protein